MLKPLLLACTLLHGALWAPLAGAADAAFPARPVRIVVPQTPGGASDALARVVGHRLGEKWGQPVVIENRPGAGGNVGMELVAAAPPDGHVLLMSYVGTQAINGALYPRLPFDPVTDFVPVATLATLPFVLVGRADAPWRSVPELVEAAGKGRVTYGSAGNGSVNHLLGEMFKAAAKVPLVHIPYRGAAPALQDLMGRQIDLVFASLPSVAPALRAGTVRALAVTSLRRATAFADIPTVAESGFQDFDVNPWFGLMAPKRTPPEVVRKINADVNEVLRSKEIAASFGAQGAEPYPASPDAFARLLQADAIKWGAVVRASGARVD
ncbi:MAG: tripartite tricarboxylate transporter substrate binding protein [Burkholderiaceae bacterium]|nr:MAG: tripartite tricarboxylate transporter substrate binding protein [Burkholderiaceae bacterium]